MKWTILGALACAAATGCSSTDAAGSSPSAATGSADADAGPETGRGDGDRSADAAGSARDASVHEDGDAGADAGPMPVDAGQPVAVVVGYGGRRVMSRDGVTWEHFVEIDPNGGDDNNLFRGVCYGNGLFVAVGGASNGITMTSTDGITWKNENRTPRAWLGNAAPLGQMFVSAGGNGLRVRSLDRGRTWQDDPGYQPIHYRDVAASAAFVVAVGHNYDTTPNVGVVATTSDGTAWTERVHSGEPFNKVAFGNGVFVAAGDTGRVARSPDGTTWTNITFTTTGGAQLIFTGTDFLISFGDAHFRSADGATWTPTAGTRFVDGFVFGHYLSFDWPARIQVSTDGASWSPAFSPMGPGFSNVAVGAASASGP